MSGLPLAPLVSFFFLLHHENASRPRRRTASSTDKRTGARILHRAPTAPPRSAPPPPLLLRAPCGRLARIQPTMDPDAEVDLDFSPFLIRYKNGRVCRLMGTSRVAASADTDTGVTSKDVAIDATSGLTVRFYVLSDVLGSRPEEKLPVLVYVHSSAFAVHSASSTEHVWFLGALVSAARVVAVSVDYRLVPELHRSSIASRPLNAGEPPPRPTSACGAPCLGRNLAAPRRLPGAGCGRPCACPGSSAVDAVRGRGQLAWSSSSGAAGILTVKEERRKGEEETN